MSKQIHIIAGPNGAGKTSHARIAIETTLSGKIYAKFIRKFQSVGCKVNLIFLKLESAELARMRVEVRLNKGGHSIDSEVIERRFQSGLDNLKTYLDIVDAASIYEASGHDFVEIATKSERQLTILNEKLWKEIYGQ
jgi:predicted ABC-type ATPase